MHESEAPLPQTNRGPSAAPRLQGTHATPPSSCPTGVHVPSASHWRRPTWCTAEATYSSANCCLVSRQVPCSMAPPKIACQCATGHCRHQSEFTQLPSRRGHFTSCLAGCVESRGRISIDDVVHTSALVVSGAALLAVPEDSSWMGISAVHYMLDCCAACCITGVQKVVWPAC